MLRVWTSAFALLSALHGGDGVLRYPDGSFESRFPLHVDECGSTTLPSGQSRLECLKKLRRHLLEDADCNRVICDNIATSTPIEVYANQSDWVPFKNLCGNLQEVFLKIFDLGVELVSREMSEQDVSDLVEAFRIFDEAAAKWLHMPDKADAPAYANSTLAVLRRHASEAAAIAASTLQAFHQDASGGLKGERLLSAGEALARRLQLFIENISVTLLLNFHVGQLEYGGRVDRGQNLVHEMYGDVDSVRVLFHEIPGKRWDSLSFLLHRLGVSERNIAMAEVGVEAANTSQRLLERNGLLSYVGVDPYVRNDGLFEDVQRRLRSFMEDGRFVLHRRTSLDAAELVPEASLDLVFLDARHDFAAVNDDITAWRPKVRPGGILSGHDFSWMFPTTAMAVYQATFAQGEERTLHLAPDGVWWLQV
eukprot:TRINITY_DN71114_c0_g1_i1.p1 TRINITY_DN71114_c0_g1~~TRINITY_DN71114_c0_g1_i1.p1  ORF type:complete len:422 (-),score=122.14 TRINITY_DN71114_c0_g1_i1:81-1346(-)